MGPYQPLFDWAQLRPDIPTVAVAGLLIVLLAALAYLVYTDITSMLLLNVITYPMIAVSALLAPVLWEDWGTHLVTGAIALVFFFIVANIKRRGQYVMGMGDVKLYTAAGLILGIGFFPCLVIANLIGVLHGLAFMLGRDTKVAHGPHIVAGMLVMLTAGVL